MSNLFKKAAVFTDIHFGLKSNSLQHNQDCNNFVDWFITKAKSANPFAYYTAAITNSFCRVLNTEKRNQNIRDDILEINGLNPSWTRQGLGSGMSSVVYEE